MTTLCGDKNTEVTWITVMTDLRKSSACVVMFANIKLMNNLRQLWEENKDSAAEEVSGGKVELEKKKNL